MTLKWGTDLPRSFIEYNGKIHVNNSLLSVALHD